MKKLLLSTIAALALFATAASANHEMFQVGETFLDANLPTCSTEEAGRAVINDMAAVEMLTPNDVESTAAAKGCEFHKMFRGTINSILCKVVSSDGLPFSLTTVTLKGETDAKFAILFTDSESLLCGE